MHLTALPILPRNLSIMDLIDASFFPFFIRLCVYPSYPQVHHQLINSIPYF